MRRGVRLGVDVGRARIGVARCDPEGLLAVPVATVRRGGDALGELRAIVAEHEPIEIVVGLPLSLGGGETASTADARSFAAELATLGIPVRLVDERLSTVSAQRDLHGAGRTAKSSRAVIDQVAAGIILQNALDSERSSGRPPGRPVDPPGGS